ncbi:MAG: hypothetical protein LUC22_07255, partial [Prevotella sp.]|nr:hypothetical protein [Prevotella sp.]
MSWIAGANVMLIVRAVIVGVLAGVIVIPRLVFTSVKDNWGKLPDDIDKTFLTVLKMAGLSLYPVWLLALLVSLLPMFTAGSIRLALDLYVSMPDIVLLAAGATALYIVGLRHDLRGSSSFVRLVVIVAVSAVFMYSGAFQYSLFGVFGVGALAGWIACVLTIIIASCIIE